MSHCGDITGKVGPARAVVRFPAAFLDRDGVINVDHGFTIRPEDLQFTPTAVSAIRLLNKVRYHVVVITNQSGIARGLFTEAEVARFHSHMAAELRAHGAHIDAFYVCPFHPEGNIPRFAREHQNRKPNPGMILAALRDLPVRHHGSFLIGDRGSDMEAAARALLPAFRITSNTGDLAAMVTEALAVHDRASQVGGL